MPYYTMPDGEQLFVREVGQGQPVLVLSGLGMLSWQWLPFLLPHLKNYQFIIPDWRGFGGSKNCSIPQDLDAIHSHWRDIECLIQHYQLDNFIVMAYSMGATTAMHGMQYGQLKRQLKTYLHIDQTAKISTDDTWKFGLFGKKHYKFKRLLKDLSIFLHQYTDYQNVEDLPPKPRQQLLEMWLNFIKIQGSNKLTPVLFKLALKHPQLQKHVLPIHSVAYMAWYIDSYLHHAEDYRAAIAQLKCPSTFFIGEKSSLYPVDGQKIVANSVKQSQQVLFKHSGHTPLITEPLKFAREIRNFLKNSIKQQ